MAAEKPGEIDFSKVQIQDSSSHPFVLRLQEALNTCSKSVETGDFHQSESAVAAVVDLLVSVCNAAVSDPDEEGNAVEVLAEVHRFICSPLLDQLVVDALSFELPKAVAKFAVLSDRCGEIAESVIDRLISTCSPRDMLSILCEALDSPCMFQTSAYFAPLFTGLSKVLLCIQRHHFEQIKVAVPVVLNVLKAVSMEYNDEDKGSGEDLFGRGIIIASSIQAVCQKLEGGRKELQALLGLFVLQIMALVSCSIGEKILSCIPLVLQLSHFFPFCGLSYLGLITGSDVDTFMNTVLGVEDGDDYLSCFSFVKHGASLSVIWGHISGEVAKAAGGDLTVVIDGLQISQTKRWQAIGMLNCIISSTDQPMELKKHTINFLLRIMDKNVSQKFCDEHGDSSFYMTSLFAALQAVEKVIIHAPDAIFRRNAFTAFKRVLGDTSSHQRFDILKALITNNDFPSMIAILIDLVKEEMLTEIRQKALSTNDVVKVENKDYPSTPFWNSNVLEFVELILKPPKRGPPSLPEHSEPVLSALNLYRFIFITETTGKTNYTGVLLENTLRKAYTGWFLPLRTLVTGILSENENDYNEFAVNVICALNPVLLVLYHCIELVEGHLKHYT